MNGRVGVQRTDENLELRIDDLLLGGVSADEREGANALPVKTLLYEASKAKVLAHVAKVQRRRLVKKKEKKKERKKGERRGLGFSYHVLGKRLAESNLVTFLDEMTNGKRVLVSITTGKPLIGHVEESEMTLLLHNSRNFLPLLSSGIDARRVVCACMQKENASLGCSLDISNHTLKVEADRFLVIVAILLNLKTGVTKDCLVIGP